MEIINNGGKGENEEIIYKFPESGIQVLIKNGGEEIKNNTYGYEVEFCSHNSDVFSFLHIDVAKIFVVYSKDQSVSASQIPDLKSKSVDKFTGKYIYESDDGKIITEVWAVETDALNVFELVSPPRRHINIANAKMEKDRICQLLVKSIQEKFGDPVNNFLGGESIFDPSGTVPGFPKKSEEPVSIYFSDWVKNLESILKSIYITNDICVFTQVNDWDKLEDKMNKKRVFKGTSIAAGKMTYDKLDPEIPYNIISNNWYDYVNGIILSKYMKVLDRIYTSQVNMPMTLVGFYFYSKKKYDNISSLYGYLKGKDNNVYISEKKKLKLKSISKMIRILTTWYWRTIIWKFHETILSKIFENKFKTTDQLTYNDIKFRAFIYLIANKLISGALGSLGESSLSKWQEVQWNIAFNKTIHNFGYIEEQILNDTEWMDYASTSKNMTGLWFKASLFDVICTEQIQDSDSGFYTFINFFNQRKFSEVFRHPIENLILSGFLDVGYFIDGPAKNFEINYKQLQMDIIFKYRKNVADLILKIGDDLIASLKDGSFFEKRNIMSQYKNTFLSYEDYKKIAPWEARMDTMLDAIKGEEGEEARYLVEHRFN